MDSDTRIKRLTYLKEKHGKAHALVEALEAEKAPEDAVNHQKRIKLSIKDEIAVIEATLKSEGVEYVI